MIVLVLTLGALSDDLTPMQVGIVSGLSLISYISYSIYTYIYPSPELTIEAFIENLDKNNGISKRITS